MVLGQYWLSSHSSLESPDPELRPREMSRSRAALSNSQSGDAPFKFQVVQHSSLGRAAAQIGWLSPAQDDDQATEAGACALMGARRRLGATEQGLSEPSTLPSHYMSSWTTACA